MTNRSVQTALLAGILTLLGGCYELAAPIYRTGVEMPMAGRHICRTATGTITLYVDEQKTGLLSPDYAYIDQHGNTARFQQLNHSMYLGQIEPPDRGVYIVFLEVMPWGDFHVYGTQTFVESNPLPELLGKHSVVVHPSTTRPGWFALFGGELELKKFLEAHDPREYVPVMDCSRQ